MGYSRNSQGTILDQISKVNMVKEELYIVKMSVLSNFNE